jgi:hypothetical protein
MGAAQSSTDHGLEGFWSCNPRNPVPQSKTGEAKDVRDKGSQ